MKKKALIVSLAMLALTACSQDNKPKPTQKELAVAEWNRARAGVMGSLARSQLEAGNLDKSADTINDALKLDPESAGLHVLCGKIAIEQGHLELAEKELSTACKLDPKNAEGEYLSGVVYQRWQKFDLAYQCYTRANEKNPSELAYLLARAETLMALQKSDDALSLLQSKCDSFEHNSIMFDAIGEIQVDQGKFAEAVISLRKASILAPEDAGIREHLAMACFSDHQYSAAADLFARLLKDETRADRADLWLALGECNMQNGAASKARDCFDKATQLSPTATAAWISLAKATMQMGDAHRAEIVLKKALSLNSKSGEAHLMLGYVRVKQNRFNDALVEFQTASTLDKADSVSLCMIGFVMEKMGKNEQAIWYYGQALKIKPDDELASHLMASVETN